MNITQFYNENKILSWSTLGIGLLVGYFGRLLITWIKDKLGIVKRADDAAQKVFKEISNAAEKGNFVEIEAVKQKTEENRLKLAENVQAAIKGKQARREFKKTVEAQKTEENRLKVAENVQAAIRGRNARVNFLKQFLPIRDALLPISIYEKWLETRDESVIVKKESRYDRYANNLRVCQFVKDKGYTAIDVPQSRKHEKEIIESRLPVERRRYIEDFGFYLENHSFFDQAVREFFDLIGHIRIYDISGNSNLDYGTLVKDNRYGRYDNVCLYIQEGVGRIGLVDLEQISDSPIKNANNLYFIVIDLISLFPLHYELIVNLANQRHPEFKNFEVKLEDLKAKLDAYTHCVYFDHKKWLESKGIALDPKKPIKVTDPEALKEKIKKRLLNLDKDGWYKGFLGDNPQDFLNVFFAQHYDSLLGDVLDMINQKLGKVKDANSLPAIIERRTFNVYPSRLKDYAKIFQKEIEPADLLEEFLFALKEAGEIFEYRPNFGVGGYARPTIFC